MDIETVEQFGKGLERMAAGLRESLSDRAGSTAPVARDTSPGKLSRMAGGA